MFYKLIQLMTIIHRTGEDSRLLTMTLEVKMTSDIALSDLGGQRSLEVGGSKQMSHIFIENNMLF